MREEIDERLGALRSTIENARSMPMSSSAVLNRAELLALLEGLEGAINDTLSRASELVGDRDAVVAQGQNEAAAIVRQARNDREKLVSDTDVYKLAQERADEAVAAAQREVDELRKETDDYVENRLANFELTLERTLEAVKRGRARLMGGHVHALGDDSDVGDIALPDHLRRD
jgi:cell division septum initiation protein DivIVA